MLTNKGQGVRKGGQGFGIPGRLADRKGLLIQRMLSKKGDRRKESQEGRSGTQHGQMGSHLMERHVNRPAHDKPCQDLNRVSVLVGT